MTLIKENLQSIIKIEGEIADIKKELEQIKKRTIDDDDALAGDVIKLEKRLKLAEIEIRKLKLQKAN